MDPRLLFQLARIIDLGSLSRAAEVLNVTQPTLTRNMQTIEARVGARVLKRGRFGVVPTEIGEQLAAQGRAIAASMQRSDEVLDQWRAGLTGELRLGVGPMLAASVMSELLATAIHGRWPYAVRVTTATAALLLTRLRERELDVAITPSRMAMQHNDLVQTEVFEDSVGIFCGVQSELAQDGRAVNIEDLRLQPWISIGALSRIHGSQEDVLETIGLRDIVPRISFSGDIATPLALMHRSNALAVLPVGLTNRLPDEIRPVHLPLDARLPSRNIAVWTHVKNADRPEVTDFVSRTSEFFRSLPD